MSDLFESDRLYFRKLTATDVSDCYVDWLNDPEVNRFLEIRHYPNTIKSCVEFVKATNADPSSRLLGVFSRGSHQHIGNAKIGFIKKHYSSAELSLFIGERKFRGCGCGTEIIRAMTSYGFDALGLKRLEAGCYEQNAGSLRAFLKAGYSVEGYFRQSVVLNGKRQGCFWLGILQGENVRDE